MNPIILLALVVLGFLLGWDWLVKRRRRAQRAEMSDEEFLRAYGPGTSATSAQILECRRNIARELGLPASKIMPDDRLRELADRLSFVGSGELALSDLFDDLEAASRGTAARSGVHPKTVRAYIEAFLKFQAMRG